MCKSNNCSHKPQRITKYGDFILENKAAMLILEGNLVASQKFLSRLSTIKDDPIAKILYDAFSTNYNIEKDLAQNWVDITDKEDTVTFMGDRPALKLDNKPDDIFTSKSRNEIKVGRLARAILQELGHKVVDKDIEIFVNTYKASKVDDSKRFELASGPIIKKYYHEKSYASRSGTLGDSCMRYDSCQTYFKIYTKNPDVCNLLVYLDENGKVLGRALVWKIHTIEAFNPKDQKPIELKVEYFMDRVYTSKDSDVVKFVNYAKSKGWLYKYKMTADSDEGLFVKLGDVTMLAKVVVKLNKAVFRRYPFVDTLSFCDGEEYISNVGFAVNEEDEDSEEGFIMMDTGGDSDTCSSCDGTGYEDYDDDNCRVCSGNGDVDCPNCRGGGEEICQSCDGDGQLPCNTCHGDCDIDCRKCNGTGDLNCEKCNGDGYWKCKTCSGEGNMGECPTCKGDGNLTCNICKGVPYHCKTCNGEGRVTRPWGRGMRTVTCTDCNGEGKGIQNVRGKEGCRCPGCSTSWYVNGRANGWRNMGTISCTNEDCIDGSIMCKDCDGKEGYHDPGCIECDECSGNGTYDCPDCRYGRMDCPRCKGEGNLGDCKSCKGSGHLGPCKNTNCDDGRVKCSRCGGSGEKPKGQGKPLCQECAGLLDDMKEKLASGDYRLR